MENKKNHRDIKFITIEIRRNYLVSEPNYHTAKKISDNLLAINMKRTRIIMGKPVYLDLSILEISKMTMHEFWYDYIKPKYGEKAKLCYMDTDSFIVYIKIENISLDISLDIMN